MRLALTGNLRIALFSRDDSPAPCSGRRCDATQAHSPEALGDPDVIAAARCADALYLVDVGENAEEDELVARDPDGALERERPRDLVPAFASAQLVDVDAAGSTIVLLVDRRPPLLVSHDSGQTWTERGAGLPPGFAIALGENPDDVLFAARNRLYVSRNGGVFWRAVGLELPEIEDAAWG
jgi:hypothetical protein